ncbi:MAG TPA: DUF1127 domain-containing protein [Dongiaceae bacterium]|jgi:uncharacterized protein YjiS (DUF1127 family)
MNQTFTLGRRDAAVPILPLHRSPDQAGLWQRLARLFHRGADRFQTIRQLNSLSDELLRDIGVDRFDIEGSVDALIDKSDRERRIPR